MDVHISCKYILQAINYVASLCCYLVQQNEGHNYVIKHEIYFHHTKTFVSKLNKKYLP